MKQNPNTSLGFYSADGFFQPLKGLTTNNLEFVSRSLYELEMMLDEHVRSEQYEKCAQIRDEIIRRAISRA